MAETKQVRVSQLVHEELQNRKGEAETFDDVLRRLLDLESEIDDLLSYYSTEQQEIARTLISEIEATGEFTRTIDSSGGVEELQFKSERNRRTIATITFDEKPSESRMNVNYRNQKGDLVMIGYVVQKTGEELTGAIMGDYGSFEQPEELVSVARQRIKNAYEAWG